MTDEKNPENKTNEIHAWMKTLPDDKKLRFAINWKIPHTLFNVASYIYDGDKEDLQYVDWYKIFLSRDLGYWSHGGRVHPQAL